MAGAFLWDAIKAGRWASMLMGNSGNDYLSFFDSIKN